MKPPKPSPGAPRVHRTIRTEILRLDGSRREATEDTLALEEPLDIRVRVGTGPERRLSVTMRTPGDDPELVTGLLFAEGIVRRASDIVAIRHEPPAGEEQEFNSVLVELAANVRVDWPRMERPFLTSSACGVCGRATLDALEADHVPIPASEGPRVEPGTLRSLPERLRAAQGVFAQTGGLHAAGLFDGSGELRLLREDVGRHNAVDKVIGRSFADGRAPLSSSVLLVSGRASYEILQKAVRGGIPFVAAVGAPSSLAVDTAKRFGVTLVGFLRGERFNVYAGPQRVAGPTPPGEERSSRTSPGRASRRR